MPTEKEMKIITKAVLLDLIEILETNKDKESYTPEEIKTMLWTYLKEENK